MGRVSLDIVELCGTVSVETEEDFNYIIDLSSQNSYHCAVMRTRLMRTPCQILYYSQF